MFFMDILFNKHKPETAEEICKEFLKNAIVNESTIGSKKFRKDLYNRLIKYGIWNNYDFCMELDEDDFVVKAKYKKASDIKLVFDIQAEIKSKHFSDRSDK